MKLSIGTFLQGDKYRIDKVLGQGGFGITYLGTHVGLNRKVAIKEFFMKEYCERDNDTSRVSLGTSGSRDMVERFRQKFLKEAQSIAALDHPNIIRIYDVFQENGTAYYVMEYHDHGSLSELVRCRGKLAEADAVSYIRQMAGALQYIHRRKIAHLDIKPGNVLLDSNSRVVLIDFGMSKHYDERGEQTSTHPAGVSHGYAPLEQYKKGGVATFSPASDIYSLGATLYKLVTGVTPPDATEVEPEELSASLSGVSVQTRKAILQAMQQKSKDRPQSVDEFLSLLDASESEEVVDDERTVIDVAPTTPKPAPRPRRWLVPVLVCLIAVLGIFGLTQIPGFGGDDDESLSPDTLVHLDTVAVPLPITDESPSKHGISKPNKVAEMSIEPVAETTSLYVSTSPSGATVYVDGKKIGKSPIEDKDFSRGKHTVKIVLEGYETYSKKYNFENKPVVINETLIAVPVRVPVQEEKPAPVKVATTGTINGYEWVDLGLSVKWATMNVGADSPGDYGDYFAWGEVHPKSEYTEANSLTNEKDMDNISGNSQYDAARYHWGDSWRLPTEKELEELKEKCRWIWSKENGHSGYTVVGPNGNRIFLPAAGYRNGTSALWVGTGGYYWSGSPRGSHTQSAYFLGFYYGTRYVSRSYRYEGRSVRPVSE